MRRYLALGLLTAASLQAAPAVAAPVRSRVPIQVEGAKHGSIIFGQLIVKVEDSDEIAGLKEKYIQKFNQVIRDAGYNVPGGEKSVFKEDSLPDSDYLLAGTITGFDCSSEQDDTCGIAVQWELLDRRTDAVVYRMEARHEEMQLEDMDGPERADALLLGTVKSILARPKFVEAVSASSATPEAPENLYESRSIKRCADAAPEMPKGSEAALRATVVVKVKKGIGSGVIISPDGFILTAAHVATSDKLHVRTKKGDLLAAEVVRIDTAKDVALLRLTEFKGETPCLHLSEVSAKAGEDIYVLGSPGGEELSFSISRGIVSGSRTFNGTNFVQTDAAINPGNSGGPLVGADGKVLAIASWKVASKEMEGLGFGVPVSTALSSLGIQFGDETDTIAPSVSRKEVSTDGAFVDAPEVPWHYVGEDAAGRTPGWVRQTRTWGYVLGGVGLGTVGASWAMHLVTKDPLSFGTWRTFNTVGWGALLVGTGMIVSSYVFKPDTAPPPEEGAAPAPPKTKVSAGFGPASVSFRVDF